MPVVSQKWSSLFVLIPLLLGGCSSSPANAPGGTSSSIDEPGYFPCDVDRVMVSVCQQCHSNPPQNGAPFPLVKYQDTERMITDQPLTSVMLSDLEGNIMPRAPVVISVADRTVLTDWLHNGAPASKTACQ